MIKSNIKILILLSLLWHLFCISIVSIELVPGEKALDRSNLPLYAEAGLGSISFLGSILGREILPSSPTSGNYKLMTRPDNKSPWIKKTTFPEDSKTKRELLAKKIFKNLVSSSNKTSAYIDLSKIIPETISILKLSPILDSSLIKNSSLSLPLIEGPIRSRGIIYKPLLSNFRMEKLSLPNLKKGSERTSQYNNVELKFLVSPEGKVTYAEKVISSGDTEVDLFWMKYLKQWQFLPPRNNESQWGKIRLSFEIEQ